MKKIFAILAIAGSLGLVACNSNKSQAPASDSSAVAPADTAAAAAPADSAAAKTDSTAAPKADSAK